MKTFFTIVALIALIVLTALAPQPSRSASFTFTCTSSAVPSSPNVLIMSMNKALGVTNNGEKMQGIVWDAMTNLKLTKTSTQSFTGPIKVRAVGIDVKVYKDTDLTNYWIIGADTNDTLIPR